MKKTLILLAGLVGVNGALTSAEGATVVFQMQHFTGGMNNRTITIKPATGGAWAIGTNLYWGTPKVLQPVAGVAQTNLVAMNYWVILDQSNVPLLMGVPDSTNTYYAHDLIAQGLKWLSYYGTNALVEGGSYVGVGTNLTAVTNGNEVILSASPAGLTQIAAGAYITTETNGNVVTVSGMAPTNGGGNYIVAGAGLAALTNGLTVTLRSLASTNPVTINVKDMPFYAVGDGTTDDTEAIQAAILSAATNFQTVIIPAGTYGVSHPIAVPQFVQIEGESIKFGTTLKALPTFNAFWNVAMPSPHTSYPTYPRIPAAILQSTTWAPDPTGEKRWAFGGYPQWPSLSPFIGSFWDGAHIKNITLDGSAVAQVSGFAADSMAENAVLENVMFMNFEDTGTWLTGGLSSPSMRNVSFWDCHNFARRFTSNPYWDAKGRNDDSGNVNGTTGGNIATYTITGDGNIPAFDQITAPVNVTVIQQKYEHPYFPSNSLVYFDVDPSYIGHGVGMNEGNRASYTLIGGNVQCGIVAGGVATNMIWIKKTGSTDPNEWPKPVITLVGVQGYFRNILRDDTYQVLGTGAAVGKTIGVDSPFEFYLNPFGFFSYSNDTNEQETHHAVQTHFPGGLVTFGTNGAATIDISGNVAGNNVSSKGRMTSVTATVTGLTPSSVVGTDGASGLVTLGAGTGISFAGGLISVTGGGGGGGGIFFEEGGVAYGVGVIFEP